MPTCRGCSGTGRKWRGPEKIDCPDCQGSGERPAKLIKPIGPRKARKMKDVSEHKQEYLKLCAAVQGHTEYIGGEPAGPCQTCGDLVALNAADFSHKNPAGMGGAGDEGGRVHAGNGTYSCRCCHAFIEQDRQAFTEHQQSPATIANGLKVEFTQATLIRAMTWRLKWFGVPQEAQNGRK